MSKKYDIFLSYRHSDGRLLARLMKTSFEKEGYRVFLDEDELMDVFSDQDVMAAIKVSTIFILLMTHDCFIRCCYENDWIRKEMQYAVEYNKSIIPIVPNNQFYDYPSSMPSHLKEILDTYQHVAISTGQDYQECMLEIIKDKIEPIVKNRRCNI